MNELFVIRIAIAVLFGIGVFGALTKFRRQWPFIIMLWAIFLRIIVA